jgi:rubrerythrin
MNPASIVVGDEKRGPGAERTPYGWSRTLCPCALRKKNLPLQKGVTNMAQLKSSKTEENLKAAFAGESQANRRYLYFAQKADVEGYNDVAAVFRSTAEGETGHAHGHLEFLEAVGDPATGLPIGATGPNLKAAIAGETHEYTDMYPGMARTAREEGFDEIADWFETLAKAEKSHAGRFQKALDTLG